MKNNINTLAGTFEIPRPIAIIAKKLGLLFQPNQGSSMYRLPANKNIPTEQKDWDCPIGTLRLSDHWDYRGNTSKNVFVTDIAIPDGQWAICINTGVKENPWKVLSIVPCQGNIVHAVDYKSINDMMNEIVKKNNKK